MSDKENRIFEKYKSIGVVKGNEIFLDHAQALKFIDDCEKMGLIILGFDLFRKLPDGKYSPVLTSADFSEIANASNSAELTAYESRQLIKNGFPDDADWISFVVKERA